MKGIGFDNPRFLFALFIAIPAFGIALFHYYRRRSLLGLLSQSALAEGVREIRLRFICSVFFFVLFLCLMITALAGPRWGTRIVPEMRRGIDVVLALDLSRSMDVQDLPLSPGIPGGEGLSRIRRGAAVARELVGASPGIRFGVAIGKGSGVLAVPLTGDTEAVINFLDALSSSAVTGRGTNLEKLLDAACSAFQNTLPTRREIILFSDGELLSGSLNAALDRAKTADIKVIALGLGSEEGGPVPVDGDILQDGTGAPVFSRLRAGTLRSAAERTGGFYVDGSRSDAGSILINHLASIDAAGTARGYRREPRPRWHLFVIAGLAALGTAKFLEKGYGRKR
ncbi:MAG: VWA domain-containing protein [Treponema sp.]|jgi:Ca-activated chloride channel family protein|nr:VWA domain-containing protein [Treponema sp.]